MDANEQIDIAGVAKSAMKRQRYEPTIGHSTPRELNNASNSLKSCRASIVLPAQVIHRGDSRGLRLAQPIPQIVSRCLVVGHAALGDDAVNHASSLSAVDRRVKQEARFQRLDEPTRTSSKGWKTQSQCFTR